MTDDFDLLLAEMIAAPQRIDRRLAELVAVLAGQEPPAPVPLAVQPDIRRRCAARIAAFLLWQGPSTDDIPNYPDRDKD